MKKIVTFAALSAIMVLLSINAHAFNVTSEQMVAVNTASQSVAPASRVQHTATKYIDPNAVMRESAKRLEKAIGRVDGKDGIAKDIGDIRTSVTSIAASDSKIVENTGKGGYLDIKLDNVTGEKSYLGKRITEEGQATRDQENRDAWITRLVVIVAVVVAVAVLVAVLWRRIGASENRVLNAIGTSANNVVQAVDSVSKKVDDAPQKIADIVLKKDVSPFSYEFGGKTLTYAAAKEIDGCVVYRELHVPKGATGNAADYERNEEDSRSKAGSNFRKTMKRYFSGEFDSDEYKLQREVIEYHIPGAKEILVAGK